MESEPMVVPHQNLTEDVGTSGSFSGSARKSGSDLATSHQSVEQEYEKSMTDLEQYSQRLSILEPRPMLLLIPSELKIMILNALEAFGDLHSLAKASAAYHAIGDRENIFTKAVLSHLESRSIGILPREFPMPRLPLRFTAFITLEETCRWSRIFDYNEHDVLGSAIVTYYRQIREECDVVHLTLDQCAALTTLIDVTGWSFVLNEMPGEISENARSAREFLHVSYDIPKLFKTNPPPEGKWQLNYKKREPERWRSADGIARTLIGHSHSITILFPNDGSGVEARGHCYETHRTFSCLENSDYFEAFSK